MAKKVPAEVQKYLNREMPAEVREYFVKQGSQGGKLSGAARMEKLTPEQRVAIHDKQAG